MKRDAQNARRHSDANKAAIRKSLEAAKAARSIVLDSGDNVLAGNGVAEQWEAMGGKVRIVETDGTELVAVRRSDVAPDSAEARQIATLDNLTADTSAHDYDLDRLRAALANDPVSRAIAEQDERLRELLKTPPQAETADAGELADKAGELQAKWSTATGQIWQLGEHRLAVGDCTDKQVVDALMQGERAQAVITDPPYGIGWDTDYTRFTTEYGTKRINHTPIVNDDKEFDPRPYLGFEKVILWGANWYCKNIPIGSWLVWDKRHPNGTAWLSDAEIAWMKGKRGVYLYAETVQGAHRKERSMHPTQKPVGLMVWCIEKADVNGIVFDPFVGSGTTLIACENLKRKCRAIEISPAYAAVTLERSSILTGQTPRLA